MAVDLRHDEHFNYGVKIMGSYRFARLEGESSQRSTGFLSPGHNSVYHDSAGNRFFLIYHQRFADRGEYHEVRVCEMFLNEDGWFVAAPFRYAGNAIGTFSRDTIPGTWKLINHGRENNTVPVESAAYSFLGNGRITGPHTGSWELGSDGRTARITIDNILYKGIFLRCYDEDSDQWVQAFTALSAEGIALWGAGAFVN